MQLGLNQRRKKKNSNINIKWNEIKKIMKGRTEERKAKWEWKEKYMEWEKKMSKS